jgi:hypothetical protein
MDAIKDLIRSAFERSGRPNDPLLEKALHEAEFKTHLKNDPRAAAYWCMAPLGLVVDHETLDIKPSAVDLELRAQIDALFSQAHEFDDKARAVRNEADRMAVNRIAAVTDLDRRRIETQRHHKCDGSPPGFCAYDSDEDPALDSCLFCGMPEERK